VGCRRAPTEEKVIRVTRNIGGREGFRTHWEAWKACFERNNPGWKLELIDLGNADGAQFYKSRIATGDLPEVVMTWSMADFLADGGNLIPLPDCYYEKFGIPLPTPYKGKRYTSQGGRQIQGIIVNKKMWADVGITEPPQSWDEFIAGLQKLKDKGYRPLVYGGREWSAHMPLMCSLHMNLYDYEPDLTKPSWNKLKIEGKVSFAKDPIARMIIEKMIYLLDHFVEKGALSDGYNEEQRDFYGGKGATWIMGCWVGGDIEPNKVDFEMAYWPMPSMTGKPPKFFSNSTIQNGWAATVSATGPKLEKAMSALEAFYDPQVHQLFLNGEAMFKIAEKVPIKGPQSDWKPAQQLYDSMAENLAKYGTATGAFIGLDDQPPHGGEMAAARVMQEILAGNKDVDDLLKKLDYGWESAQKAR